MKQRSHARLVALQETVVKMEKARRSALIAEIAEITSNYSCALDMLTLPGAAVPPEIAALCCRASEAKLLNLSKAYEDAEKVIGGEGQQLKLLERRAALECRRNGQNQERSETMEIIEQLATQQARTSN